MARSNEKLFKKGFHRQFYVGKQTALGNSVVSMLETLKPLLCHSDLKHLVAM